MKCQVCGRREGFKVLARYRLESECSEDPVENYEILKVVRPLVICGFCLNKAKAYGYFGNSRIYVEEILEAPIEVV